MIIKNVCCVHIDCLLTQMELLACSHSVLVIILINALTYTCTYFVGVSIRMLVNPWLNVLQAGLACGGTVLLQLCLSPQMQKHYETLVFFVLYHDRCSTYLTSLGFIGIVSFNKSLPLWSSTLFCG